MDYLDVLRSNGWIADPTDKVRVQAVHHPRCPAPQGRRCWCSPQLVLAARPAYGRQGDREPDLPQREIASGE